VGTIGLSGLLIIAVVVLLVFGPKRLPQVGRQLGRGMREFKDSVGEPAGEIKAALDAPREVRAALNPATQVKEAMGLAPLVAEESAAGGEAANAAAPASTDGPASP
jgi:sec-independent protein translocase protein TatA